MAGSDSILKRPTFASSNNSLAKFVARPVLRFIDREVAGGVLLLVATAAALLWVNLGWGESYHDFWHTEIELAVGSWHLPHMSVGHFVNDALMALFFFVVGLEIKRELVTGDLSSPRAAALPAIGALGGMVVDDVVEAFVTQMNGGATLTLAPRDWRPDRLAQMMGSEFLGQFAERPAFNENGTPDGSVNGGGFY